MSKNNVYNILSLEILHRDNKCDVFSMDANFVQLVIAYYLDNWITNELLASGMCNLCIVNEYMNVI